MEKKLYIFTKSSLIHINEYEDNFESGSKIIIFSDDLKKIISEKEKKGEVIRSITKCEENFSVEFFSLDSFYYQSNNLTLSLLSIKKNYKDYNIYIVTTDSNEMLTAIYNEVKVYSTKTINDKTCGESNCFNTKNVVLDTSYIANMSNLSLLENPDVYKHILFFVLQELVNIGNDSQLFALIPYINEKEKYNIKIVKDFTIPHSSEIIPQPDLYHIAYILEKEDFKHYTLLTNDLQLLMEAKLQRIHTAKPIDIIYSKYNTVVNTTDKNKTISKIDNLTLEIVKINKFYYIYNDSLIDKIFSNLVLQKGKYAQKIKGIKYLPVNLNDYVKFTDGKIYQIVSLTDKQNLKEIKL